MAKSPAPKLPKAPRLFIQSVAHPNVVNAEPVPAVPTTVGSALADPRPHPGNATPVNKAAGDLGWEGLPPVKNPRPYKLKG